MNHDSIAIAAKDESLIGAVERLAQQLNLPIVPHKTTSYLFLLVLTTEHLQLLYFGEKKLNPIYVDFIHGKSLHRYQYGGGRGQLISRAVGLANHPKATILDVTAGLGEDAFVLASLGAKVTMVERSPIIAALLADGLERARSADWFQKLSLELIADDSQHYLQHLTDTTMPDIIYLDPMFPHKTKSALAKKEMRILRELVGDDLDANALLKLALKSARKRVVVKRPRHAATLTASKVDIVFAGKSSRYDVYTP